MKKIFDLTSFKDEQICLIAQELGIILDKNGIKVKASLDESINGLEISATTKEINIVYSQRAYLFRALTLIVEQKTDDFHIVESAKFKSNGLMVDCSRNAVLKPQKVKELIRFMAKSGMNMLMLYTEDTFEVEGHPYFGYMRGRYSAEELKEFDDYAFGFGIEMIPCIQTLGHMEMVLKWPEYHLYKDTNDVLCVEKDRTYKLIKDMLSSLRKVFRTKKIHIGMDEAESIGRGDYYYYNKTKEHPDNKSSFELFFEHLRRVSEICTEFDFKPMFWSDMIFKFANGNYRDRTPLSQNVIDMLPENITPVYWEYLKEEYEQYDSLMKNHIQLSKSTIFADGIWKWMGFLPSLTPSMRRMRTSLKAAKENGIQDVFATIWGDNGADCSLFAILPGMQLQAELGFADEISDERLSERLKICTGACMEDFSILDMPELTEQQNNGLNNPNKYLLFQDVLLGLLDLHIPKNTAATYEKIYVKAGEIAKKDGPFQYVFKTAEALYGVLALKSELGKNLKSAYDIEDKDTMLEIATVIIPELIIRVEKFQKCLMTQWMIENKSFGFEVQDQRLGGLLQRLKTTSEVIQEYLNGEIDNIEELEEKRLIFGWGKIDEHMCHIYWNSVITAGYL